MNRSVYKHILKVIGRDAERIWPLSKIVRDTYYLLQYLSMSGKAVILITII